MNIGPNNSHQQSLTENVTPLPEKRTKRYTPIALQ
jgi:hypothetical protein